MPTDTDTEIEAEPTIEQDAVSPADRSGRRSVLHGVRRVATPASIVVAWIVVVTQWNDNDSALFNWATITAGVVLGVVTILWLVSLRFPALRRALLPFEGGLVVAAVVLAWATGGREVDLLGDRIAIAIGFGVVAALLLAFMQQLVAGRDRAWAWLAGVVVVCAAAGIAVPATLDWLDTSEPMSYDAAFAGEILSRSTDEGFRLDDISVLYDAPTLGGGYNDEAAAAMYGIGYATPAVMIDPATGLPADTASPTEPAMAQAVPAPSMPGSVEGSISSVPTVRNDWGRLLAKPNGAITLAVQPGIATGVTDPIVGSLRRGGCSDPAGKELLSVKLGRATRDRIERTLPMRVDDLRIEDKLSFVIGTAEPLAPTRCIQLLSGSGIALAKLGAASFNDECLKPLALPRGSEYLVRSSSFQDASCARRFSDFAEISAALLVPRGSVTAYRDCHRTHEGRVVATERKLPDGAIAVTYPDYVYGQCLQYGVNGMTYGTGYASGAVGMASATPTPTPYDGDPDAAGAPALVEPMSPATTSPPGPSAPAAAAPSMLGTPGVPNEDLDGLTPEEAMAKIR